MPTTIAEQERISTTVQAGSWRSISLVYLYSVLTAASISKLVPIEAELERTFGATPASIGVAISLISVSSAIAATVGGAIIDRVGARRAIVFTSVIVALSDVIGFLSTSMFMLDVARLIEGIEFIGIIAAAPALIIATTSGTLRVKAMSLWSTYTPTGYSLGLLLAAPFAGTSAWRWTFILHGGLFLLAACLGGMLPRSPRTPDRSSSTQGRSRLLELLSTYGEIKPLRLSVANAFLVSIGLGTSVVVPAYFARTHQVSIGTSSAILAFSNAAMILGGILAGLLLSRNMQAMRLYLMVALGGILSGVFLYAPQVSFWVAVVMLLVWLLTTGAAVAIIMSLLPHVVRDPQRGAAASGLLAQVMALGTLITPAIFFSILSEGNWMYFAAIIIGGWIISVLALPAAGGPQRTEPRA
jgi:MFS family permease